MSKRNRTLIGICIITLSVALAGCNSASDTAQQGSMYNSNTNNNMSGGRSDMTSGTRGAGMNGGSMNGGGNDTTR